MTIRTALTHSAMKRLIALTAAYVLALQALFGAGAQLRVLLTETPGLCTIWGFEDTGSPKHAADACAAHCVGHSSADAANMASLSALVLTLTGWTYLQARGRQFTPHHALAFRGRGPPR